MRVLVARVVNQNAAQRTVRIAGAHIDSQIFGNRSEHPFLQQEGGDPIANLPLELPERCKAGRYQPQVQCIASGDDDQGESDRWTGQSEWRQSCRSHHRDLAVARQALINELYDNEGRDRQNDHDKAGNQ